MTVKELSKLYWLKREIAADEAKLEALRADWRETQSKLWELRESMDGGLIGSPPLSDMPKGSGVGKQVESLVLQACVYEEKLKAQADAIRDLEALISSRHTTKLLEQKRLEAYINEIANSPLRRIFTLRFVDGCSWQGVADGMGKNHKAESVRRACYRHLKGETVDEIE